MNLSGWNTNKNILFLVDLLCKDTFVQSELREKIKTVFSEFLEVKNISSYQFQKYKKTFKQMTQVIFITYGVKLSSFDSISLWFEPAVSGFEQA